jgi:hypothetical protein
MDFRPAVWTPRTLVFTRNQIKPPELRIGHDLFPQRSGPGRDYLNYGLHSIASFSRKSLALQCLFQFAGDQKGHSISAKGAHPHHSLGHRPGIFEIRSDQR